MQILAISDSIEGTRYDVARKASTIKAYKASPIFAVPEYVTGEESYRTDISECLDYCFTECPPDCIAISLVRNASDIKLIADRLANCEHSCAISEISLISKDGEVLVSAETYNAFMQYLLPQLQFLSINIYEAELLSQIACSDEASIAKAASVISSKHSVIVLITGSERSNWKELLYFGNNAMWLSAEDTCRTYNKERSLLMAIACELASDKSIVDAVKDARKFVSAKPKPEVQAKPSVNPAMYMQPQFSFTARAAQKRTEQESKPVEPKPNVEPAPVQNLVSPAKSLRDIARKIDGTEAASAAEPAVTSGIEEPQPGPKGTVSEIKEREMRSSADSISELQAMLERMKKLSEM